MLSWQYSLKGQTTSIQHHITVRESERERDRQTERHTEKAFAALYPTALCLSAYNAMYFQRRPHCATTAIRDGLEIAKNILWTLKPGCFVRRAVVSAPLQTGISRQCMISGYSRSSFLSPARSSRIT